MAEFYLQGRSRDTRHTAACNTEILGLLAVFLRQLRHSVGLLLISKVPWSTITCSNFIGAEVYEKTKVLSGELFYQHKRKAKNTLLSIFMHPSISRYYERVQFTTKLTVFTVYSFLSCRGNRKGHGVHQPVIKAGSFLLGKLEYEREIVS